MLDAGLNQLLFNFFEWLIYQFIGLNFFIIYPPHEFFIFIQPFYLSEDILNWTEVAAIWDVENQLDVFLVAVLPYLLSQVYTEVI
jgi:hypothetical protein